MKLSLTVLHFLLLGFTLTNTTNPADEIMKLAQFRESCPINPPPLQFHSSVIVLGASETDKHNVVAALTSNSTIYKKNATSKNSPVASAPPPSPPSWWLTIFCANIITDLESSTTFYIQPGATDSDPDTPEPISAEAAEIISNFYLSDFIENSSRMKLLLTIHIFSLRDRNKRYPYLRDLLAKTQKLVSNFERFNIHSIALIVLTDNTDESQSDNLLLEVVGLISYVCKKSPEEEYKEFYEKFVQMISITDENGVYTRVVVLNANPTLSQIEWLSKVVHKELHYHNIKEGDLIVELSSSRSSVKKKVNATLIAVDSALSKSMIGLNNQIKQVYTMKLLSGDNSFFTTKQELESFHSFFMQSFTQDVLHSSGFSKLSYLSLIKSFQSLDNFGIKLTDEQLTNIRIGLECIYRFNKTMSCIKYETYYTPKRWILELNSSIKYIEKLNYDFKCLSNDKNYLGVLTNNNLLTNFTTHDDDNSDHVAPDLFKREVLECLGDHYHSDVNVMSNHISNYVSNNSILHYVCVNTSPDEEPLLRVSGDFISLAHVNFSYCSPQQVQIIELFAWNTLYIDTTHTNTNQSSYPGIQRITVLSPRIFIAPGSTLDFSGRNGTAHTRGKAIDSKDFGQNGDDGLDGNPGESGASVLIITRTIRTQTSSTKPILTIISNGGHGGPGQHGGNGAPGIAGKMAEPPHKNDTISNENGFELSPNSKRELFLKRRGTPGQQGGNGGDGGQGGLPGLGGSVRFLILDHTLSRYNSDISDNINDDIISNTWISKYITVVSQNGTEGPCGNGGDGGQGGLNGISLLSKNLYECSMVTKNCSKTFQQQSWVSYMGLKEVGTGPKGLPGRRCGGNDNKKQDRLIMQPQLHSLKSRSISTYKRLAKDISSLSELRQLVLEPFLESLEMPQVTEFYDSYALLDEFKYLSNQSNTLLSKEEALKAWDMFSTRLSHFLNNSPSLSSDDQQVAIYLHAASISKSLALSEDTFERLELKLITDVSLYLEQTESKLHELQKLEKNVIINRRLDKYENDNYRNVRDAEELKSRIKSSFRVNQQQIDSNMNDLIEEVTSLEMREKAYQNVVKKNWAQHLFLEQCLGVVDLLDKSLSILGPKTFVFRKFLQVGSKVAKTVWKPKYDISTTTTSIPIPTLPSSFNSEEHSADYNEADNDDDTKEFNETVLELQTRMSKFSYVPEISELINQTQVTRDSAMLNVPGNKTALQVYKTYLYNKIVSCEEKIKISNITKSPGKAKSPLKALEESKNQFYFYTYYDQSYTRLKKSSGVLNIAVSSVDQERDQYDLKLQKLQQYGNNLRHKITPYLASTVDNLLDQLPLLSEWEITTIIGDLKHLMESVTQKTQASKNLIKHLDKLENGITSMIKIDKNINELNKDFERLEFLANLEKETSQLPIENKSLLKSLEEIELSIQSNLILMEYRSVLNTIAQMEFPFAHYYFKDLDGMRNVDSWEQLLNSTQDHIHRNFVKVKNKIDELKSVISNAKDVHGYNGPFSNKVPFYRWDSEEYSSSIQDLLSSGKEVQFQADIKNSPKCKNAIKFKSLKLLFVAVNKTVQKHLDEFLTNFEIEMTHLGRSFYRLEDKFYVIPSSNITLSYHVDESRAMLKNNAYGKLEEAQPILSPYATWNFKLEPLPSSNRSVSSNDVWLKSRIDLILEGVGSYVRCNTSIINHDSLRMSRYYIEANI